MTKHPEPKETAMTKHPEPIGQPRRLYVVNLEARAHAVVIARGRDRVESALHIPTWITDDDFVASSVTEITSVEGIALPDAMPDAEEAEDVPDGSWREILEVLLEEQRQAKIEAEFLAKQIPLLDSNTAAD